MISPLACWKRWSKQGEASVAARQRSKDCVCRRPGAPGGDRAEGLPAARIRRGRPAGVHGVAARTRVQARSTNPVERVNREIGRRSDVVGSFPDDTPAIRLAGTLLIEQNDEWIVCRRYLWKSRCARSSTPTRTARTLSPQFRRRWTSSPPQPEPLTSSPTSRYTTSRDLAALAPAGRRLRRDAGAIYAPVT